jgi:hypothetical protein
VVASWAENRSEFTQEFIGNQNGKTPYNMTFHAYLSQFMAETSLNRLLSLIYSTDYAKDNFRRFLGLL